MLRLYQSAPSGNCYKLRLLLTQLGMTFERVEVDIFKGETRTPEFLCKNPNGRVPVLEIEDSRFLWESNAIMLFLADETSFYPADKWTRSLIWQWLCFEQYSHEPYIATSRYWITLLAKPQEYREEIERRREPGYRALRVMEQHLENNQFFVGDRYTIADIGLYAYTHVAPEGGFDLGGFPAIDAWMKRVKNTSGYISITE